MKKGLKITFIVVGVLVGIILLDTLQARIIKNRSIMNNKVDLEVKEIIDTTKNINDFTCAEALEEFYRDNNYVYYYNCIKSNYILVRYTNGSEETITNALKYGTITIKDLDKYNISYIKENK